MDKIKEKILKEMKSRKVSKSKLAKNVGVSTMTIYNWFYGHDISASTFVKILDYLNIGYDR